MAQIHPEVLGGRFKHDDIYAGENPMDPRARMKGHPTSPGYRDAYVARAGDPGAADGTPGVPRVQPTPQSGTHGAPGPMGNPMQPHTLYDGPTDLPNGVR